MPQNCGFRVYETKPVNFPSTACIRLPWKEKTENVFDKEAGIKMLSKFICLKAMDEYNRGMKNVNKVMDQLRGSYWFDCWTCMCKWCWSIWMWGVQVLRIDNAYVLYKSAHLSC
jgi:hypothetical protein